MDYNDPRGQEEIPEYKDHQVKRERKVILVHKGLKELVVLMKVLYLKNLTMEVLWEVLHIPL